MTDLKNITISDFDEEQNGTWTAHVLTEKKEFFFISFSTSYWRWTEQEEEPWGTQTIYCYDFDPITEINIIDENGDDVNLNDFNNVKNAINIIERDFLHYLLSYDPKGN